LVNAPFAPDDLFIIPRAMATGTQMPARTPEVDVIEEELVWIEPLWRVLIHNDDVTTFEFVERMLQTIFKLSREMAEHIAWLTHTNGIALVCVRPRSEAERLVGQAIFAARMEGFPLMLTCEPDE